MSKKILVISSSPRKGANSDTLCDEFIRGAKEAGHEVEKVALRDLKIHPCFACYYCASHTDECVQNDDIPQVMLKMEHADVVVLATPVYFYSVDISEFAVNKLRDRGSLSVRTIVTNVQDFVVNVRKGVL